jgi:hypothetical protein
MTSNRAITTLHTTEETHRELTIDAIETRVRAS